MEGHPGMPRETIGALRTEQNWVGGGSFGPRDAEYIPPPPEDVHRLLEDLVAFSARTDLTSVALAALAHAQFEVIHPFVDGNGRVGRALLQQLLVKRAGLEAPVPVSVPWSRDTERYISGIRAFQDGDADSWLLFASWSVIEAVGWVTEMTRGVEELLGSGWLGPQESRGERLGRRVSQPRIDDLGQSARGDRDSYQEREQLTRSSLPSPTRGESRLPGRLDRQPDCHWPPTRGRRSGRCSQFRLL